jgi:hypothetical protein
MMIRLIPQACLDCQDSQVESGAIGYDPKGWVRNCCALAGTPRMLVGLLDEPFLVMEPRRAGIHKVMLTFYE